MLIDDCNDNNGLIHLGADDANCNGIDEDCDGTPDDGYIPANCLTCQNGVVVNSSATWYLDADADGHAASSTISCLSPGTGYTTTILPIDDCDDNNGSIHPGAADTNCNGIDEDCNGTADDGYVAANCLTCQNGVVVNSSSTWYLDADTDGHAISSTVSCLSPGLGYTTTVLPIDDCNDADGAIHPGASDTNCNGIDEDCDGTADDGYIPANCLTCQNGSEVNSSATWYLDADTDGHATSSTVSCLSPGLGYTTTVLPIDDCNDNNGLIHPGAADTNCNNIDEDCDGTPDDGYIPANCLTCQNGMVVNSSATWYLDADADGHAASSTVSCLSPGTGYTTTILPIDDCDDNNGSIHPGASDTNCNAIDEDCDGIPDDGYVAANCLTCQNGSEVNSSATWYLDADMDGHAISSTVSCLSPGLGYTTTVLPIDDCNDADGAIHPGASDTNCNNIDEDCDGTPDDGYIAANCLNCQNGVELNSSATWYLDADMDGHALSSTVSCLSPGAGYTTTVLPIDDCNDNNGLIHPGAADTNCNGIDEDCDGTADDGYIAANCLTCQNGVVVNSSATWYLDADSDGHAISSTVSCLSPSTGYTTTVLPIDDCNDANGAIHPGASDTNCNDIDEDCDGTPDDGYIAANCLTCQNGSEVNSSATWYLDADSDGYALSSTVSCLSPGLGYTTAVLPIDDCNDNNGSIHPGAADTNCNGIDEDCDGTPDDGYIAANCLTCQNGVVVNSSATWYLDADTDGHALSSTVSCLSPGLGYTTTVLPIDDCDDANGAIHPGASDTNCNGIDEDCDGTADDGYIPANCLTCQNGSEVNSSATWYLDADTDGHAVSSTVSCLSPGLGYTATVLPIDDCNDSNGSIHPGAADTNCNNIDEDCDGTSDDGYNAANCLTCQNGSEVNSSATWYLDADTDGHAVSSTVSCLSPGLGYTTTVLPIDDCNDNNGSIHPGTADTNCNGIDEDCDGTADDGYIAANCLTCQNGVVVNSSATWYLDADMDGHALSSTVSCLSPGVGYTTTVLPIDDCNDANGAIHPGASDANCNGIDEDCDGTADDGYIAANCLTCQSGSIVNSSATWYLDADTDGHAVSSTVSCLSPGLGYTTTVLPIDDCDDNNGSIHPGASDSNCNNIDEDCDGTPDDGYIAAICLTCQIGVVVNSSSTWYLDADADGHAISSTVSCLSPGLGYTTTALPIDDCDDANGSIHPGAADTNCNNIDEDCDGTPDDGYITANCLTCQNGVEVNSSATWYLDADSDGYAISTSVSCSSPGIGYGTTTKPLGDCNDGNTAIHPNVADTNCNGIDEDCDGTADDGYIAANCLTCQNGVLNNSSATWYLDADSDGYAISTTVSCSSPGIGYGTTTKPLGDCNDGNPAIHPNAADTNCNGIDEDCDGTPDDGYISANCLTCQNGQVVNSSTIWYLDADSDGYAISTSVSCSSPGIGYGTAVKPLGDCNDGNPAIHPNAADTNCNGIDEDCDGTPDDGYIAANCLTCQNGVLNNSSATWYLDADGDGYAISITVSCSSPGIGYGTITKPLSDCNDANPAFHPNASDTNCNGIDEDCDGTPDDGYIAAICLSCLNGQVVNSSTTWYLDADNDGYAISTTVSCSSPGIGYGTATKPLGDCNDLNPAIHPNAADTNCNGIDEDCDGTADDGYIAANCLSCQNGQVINQLPLTPLTNVIQPSCVTTTGTIIVTNKGPLDSVSFNNGLMYQISNSKNGLTTGNYIVKIKTTSGCTSIGVNVAILIAPVIPSAPLLSLSQPSCSVFTGTITITNKASLDSASFNNGSTFQISNSKSGLVAGTYQVKIKSVNGCITSSTSAILVPASVNVTINNLDTAYYKYDPTFILSGTPAGGEFRIDGGPTLFNIFSPLILNLGYHTVTYTVIQAKCTTSVSKQVRIKSTPLIADGIQCYTIENYYLFNSGKVAGIQNGSNSNNTAVNQQTLSTVLHQKWKVETIGGFKRIKNRASGLYLKVLNNGNIVQGSFSSPAAEWTIHENNPTGTFHILNRSNGRYLTANSNGALYRLTTASGNVIPGFDQNFIFNPVPCSVPSSLMAAEPSLLPGNKNANYKLSKAKLESRIELYPNPGNGLVTIRMHDIDITQSPTLSIYSVLGSKVWMKKIDSKEKMDIRLELDDQIAPDGMYILFLNTPDQTFEKKFIIKR